MVDLWYAEDGIIWVSGTLLGTNVVGSDFTCYVKEISITGGDRDVEQVQTFGSGCSSALFEKKAELVEASITTLKKNNLLARALMSGTAAAEGTIVGNTTRAPVSILYQWADRSNANGNGMRVKMANAYCTGKELSLSVDDSMEETFTFKCLPGNYQEEFKTNQTGLSLVL